MITLGLTGSIGMGKSTVADMFADQGVPVFDADETVHRLQGPGGALVEAIEAAFPDTTGEHGVDRTALREAVFGNEAAFARLEALVVDSIMRGDADETIRTRASALGWVEAGNVAVVVGRAPEAVEADVDRARADAGFADLGAAVGLPLPGSALPLAEEDPWPVRGSAHHVA